LLLCLVVSGCSAKDALVGSGKLTTREFELADFTAVDISHAFAANITQGSAFKVSVTADDNVMEHVKVAKTGSTLKIGMDPEWNYRNVTLKASITMPTLRAVSLAGASSAAIEGFKSTDGFKANLLGASRLEGTIESNSLALEAMGASKATLKGAAKDAKLSAVGASQLNLSDFTLENADVSLAGASRAAVNAKAKLDYSLVGGSHLDYYGNPTIGKREAVGASSASSR
jgi:hypothetical protein